MSAWSFRKWELDNYRKFISCASRLAENNSKVIAHLQNGIHDNHSMPSRRGGHNAGGRLGKGGSPKFRCCYQLETTGKPLCRWDLPMFRLSQLHLLLGSLAQDRGLPGNQNGDSRATYRTAGFWCIRVFGTVGRCTENTLPHF